MSEPYLITTAAELAELAAGLAPDTPVLVGFSQRESGADPRSPDGWVVSAEYEYVTAADAEAGLVADGPVRVPEAGHREECPDPDDILHACALSRVLVLRARHLAEAGWLGSEAAPVSGEVRRRVAAHAPDGDLTRYLSEVAAHLEEVREELLRATVGGFPAAPKTSPLAHHLRRVAAALSVACREGWEATAFGRQCELAQGVLDDERACDQERLNAVLVHLPQTPGEGEVGCSVHAAAALVAIPGAYIEASAS